MSHSIHDRSLSPKPGPDRGTRGREDARGAAAGADVLVGFRSFERSIFNEASSSRSDRGATRPAISSCDVPDIDPPPLGPKGLPRLADLSESLAPRLYHSVTKSS